MHDLLTLIDRNGLGFFILALVLISAGYRVVIAFINRNKPECPCECDDEEVVAMGGEEEDTHHESR